MQTEIAVIGAGLFFLGIIVWYVSRNLKRTLQVISGWGLYEGYNFLFDFVFWPILQGYFGVVGIGILIILALVNNFLILLWYQKQKTDWFGVNVLEDIKSKGHFWVNNSNNNSKIKKVSLFIPKLFFKFFIWLLNKNDVFAFVTLSVWQDSFLESLTIVITQFLLQARY
jgi:hypothetical protein